MSRLMSVSHTATAVEDQTKDMTRRLGWRFLKPGDRLTLCRKVMGRRHTCSTCGGLGVVDLTPDDYPDSYVEQIDLDALAEDCHDCDGEGWVVDPLERLAEVEVTAVRFERLWDITAADVVREGVPVAVFDEWYSDTGQPTEGAWVRWFCESMGCSPDCEVTVIEWRYLS